MQLIQQLKNIKLKEPIFSTQKQKEPNFLKFFNQYL